MKKLNEAKRIVFKIGTNVLRNDEGEISLSRIYSFIEDIAKLYKQGKEVIIVTSGAVGLGSKKVKISSPDTLAVKQACAAIGQSHLMSIYEDGFEKYGIVTAQVLLTEEDFTHRVKYLNLSTVLNELLKLKTIPIINQNDCVSATELEESAHGVYEVSFSDNDKLSALVASKLDADLLVILSDIDGLYTDNPKENKDAEFISEVKEVTTDIEKLGLSASKGGRGGMKTKLQAAKVVTRSGGYALIANGKTPQIIKKLFSGEAKNTLFLPTEKLQGKKRWIGFATNISGQIIVNDGAKKAMTQKDSSLLPIGIVEVRGKFSKGDVVAILDTDGEEFARGITNYNLKDTKNIIGQPSDKILEILGHKNYDAVVGKDNIVIL